MGRRVRHVENGSARQQGWVIEVLKSGMKGGKSWGINVGRDELCRE